MCGIAGIIASDARSYEKALRQMVDALRHRGPDASGTYFFNNCALGHARLSVIDLCSGHQPMITLDSNTGITFNGEIYGYKSIKESLTDYIYQTTSDTEVILALYQQYGYKLLDRLPGMFSFAIWDESRQELFCARDRFGEKPFYYCFGSRGEFLFASEIKALLASGLIRPVIDRKALTHYVKRLYIHPTQTIYQNIYILPPAHSLRYVSGSVHVERYWRLPETRDDIELPEAVEQFKVLLDQSISKQLIADVPVAAFLSGGLDSSTIVTVASNHQSRLKTLAFGFADTFNELPYARQVAELYQTEHIELVDEEADIGELLRKMLEVYDEPFADSSNIPTYLISKLACQHVKVALTGDAGDELLAGYSWYKPLLNIEEDRKVNPWLHYMLRLARRLSPKLGISLKGQWQSKLQSMGYYQRVSSVARSHYKNQFFTNSELSNLGLNAYDTTVIRPDEFEISNTVDDALRIDLQDYMPGDILVKIDRASMANGLELRAPFLDVDFATFCISLPSRLKISAEEDKLILREAFANTWPESVRYRSKHGFGAPVEEWFERDSVRELKETYLENPGEKIFSLISYNNSRNIVEQDDYQTWILLVLAMWMDKYEFDLV